MNAIELTDEEARGVLKWLDLQEKFERWCRPMPKDFLRQWPAEKREITPTFTIEHYERMGEAEPVVRKETATL